MTFVAFPFQPTFGYLDAVQTYYGMYPKAFEPTAGVDQRIYGEGGYIPSSYGTGRRQPNRVRRTRLEWDWS